MEELWTPYSAGLRRVFEADVVKQGEFGTKKRHPAVAHLAQAQPRAIVAGEIAGAWVRFGVFGAQLKNMAEAMEVALRTNQGPAAKLADE